MTEDELELMRELYQAWVDALSDLFDQAEFRDPRSYAEHDLECRVCAMLGLPAPDGYEED